MKKILILALLLCVAGFAFGQVHVYYTDDATLRWDDPGIGDASQIVEYEVWRSAYPVADHDAPDVLVGVVSSVPELYIMIPDDDTGHSYAVRLKVTEGTIVGYSDLLWSDLDGVDSAGNPRPFIYARKPPRPTGLRMVVP